MVGTAVVSMGYVNAAMMHFGNSVVVPTYYGMFTVGSVASVALVYREVYIHVYIHVYICICIYIYIYIYVYIYTYI